MSKIIFLSILSIFFQFCASEPVKPASDPIAELNAELKPARMQGFDLAQATVSKSELADWETKFLPVVKSVYDRIPAGHKLQVRGNADAAGDDKVNQLLGMKRAKYVQDYLVKKGFNTAKMVIVSIGESELMADIKDPNDDDHRRVNFRVVKE